MENTIKKFIETQKWQYQVLRDQPDQKVYKLGFTLNNGRVDIFVDIRIEPMLVLIFTVCPVQIPQNHRSRVSELITRANSGLILGNFELDFDDGTLRYKSSYIYDDTFPEQEEVFGRNLYVNFDAMDKLLPGVMSVIYANVIPAQAYQQLLALQDPSVN